MWQQLVNSIRVMSWNSGNTVRKLKSWINRISSVLDTNKWHQIVSQNLKFFLKHPVYCKDNRYGFFGTETWSMQRSIEYNLEMKDTNFTSICKQGSKGLEQHWVRAWFMQSTANCVNHVLWLVVCVCLQCIIVCSSFTLQHVQNYAGHSVR